jgi:outer membrane protein TolC
MTNIKVMEKKMIIKGLSELRALFVHFVVNRIFKPQITQSFAQRVYSRFFVWMIMLLTNTVNVTAQTLDEYLKQAAQNNPTVKAKYQEYYAALEKVPQAGTLPDPQLSFSMFIGRDGLFMERYMGEQLTELSVMQMFPWAGSLGAAKEEASYMAQMKFATFQESKINLYHEVRTVWYDLYRVQKELQLLNQEKEILKTYEQLALTRFKTGTSGQATLNNPAATSSTKSSSTSGSSGMSMGSAVQQSNTQTSESMASTGMSGGSSGSMVDVLLIQLQIKSLDTRIAILKASIKPLTTRFNNLLNRDTYESIQMADTLASIDLPAMISIIKDSVIQNHPMVKMYEWDEKVRETQQRMASLMGKPMIGLGLSYMVFRPRADDMVGIMGGDNMFMPMVTMTLPIYRKKYTSQIKEAGFMQQSARYNKEAAQLELLSDLENLLFDYESSHQRLSLLSDQTEITHQAIRLMLTSYSTGGTGMDEILRQRQSLLNYQQEQLNTLTEQHTIVSSITKLMGVDIK